MRVVQLLHQAGCPRGSHRWLGFDHVEFKPDRQVCLPTPGERHRLCQWRALSRCKPLTMHKPTHWGAGARGDVQRATALGVGRRFRRGCTSGRNRTLTPRLVLSIDPTWRLNASFKVWRGEAVSAGAVSRTADWRQGRANGFCTVRCCCVALHSNRPYLSTVTDGRIAAHDGR
jgi:hypothetical protein